jgi:hypothetical protein
MINYVQLFALGPAHPGLIGAVIGQDIPLEAEDVLETGAPEVFQNRDVGLREPGLEFEGDIRADEAGTACHKDILHRADIIAKISESSKL